MEGLPVFRGRVGCMTAPWHSEVRADGQRRTAAARIRRALDRLWLRALCCVFHFDAWHAGAPYSCRAYKSQVVALANSVSPGIVVEIGCGLGDILSRIDADERIGADIDAGVIRAARVLHPFGATWIHGDASAAVRFLPEGKTVDCLILVNWIHGLSAEVLGDMLAPLLRRTGYLIVDAINPDGPSSYRHKHDFSFLASIAQRVSIVPVPGESRSLLLFKVSG